MVLSKGVVTMQRHSQNINLHLYYELTFEGLPVMWEKGPFIHEYLSRLKQTIDLALMQYPRLMAFRVDLRYPATIQLPPEVYQSSVISRFIESFKAKIEHNRACARELNPNSHGCKVRYVWARENALGGNSHYHVLILLNRDAFYSCGLLSSQNSNMYSRTQEAWASALGLPVELVSGLVNFPVQSTYKIDRGANEKDELPKLFYRASYLCKSATKSYGDRQRRFDTSRG